MAKTTYEMDRLFAQKDIDERYLVYGQCQDDGEFSAFDIRKQNFKCPECSGTKYDRRSIVSLRTFNPTVHNKKKKRKK